MTVFKSIKTQAYQIIFWQLIIIMGLAVLIFLLRGIQNGFSTLIGGLAYWIPTLMFLLRVTSYAGAQAAMRFVVALFVGEAVKLCLTGIIFLLAVKYLPLHLLYAVIGLVGAVMAYWIASITTVYRQGVN